jgi:hypothetical protein
MRKTWILLAAGIGLSLAACKNSDKSHDNHDHGKTAAPKTPEDSLEAAVIEGHDVGMAKFGKLKSLQKEVALLMDSLGRLPGKARAAAEPLRARAEQTGKDLTVAIEGMEKWMREFNLDSARENVEQRIRYLKDEKLKVERVKESILGSLAKADSLLRSKF